MKVLTQQFKSTLARIIFCVLLILIFLLCFFCCDKKNGMSSDNNNKKNEPQIIWSPPPEKKLYEHDKYGRLDYINDENGDIFVDYHYSGQQLIGYNQYIRFFNIGDDGEIDISVSILEDNSTVQEYPYQLTVASNQGYTLVVEGKAGPRWVMTERILSVSCPNAVETDSSSSTWTGVSDHIYRSISRVYREGNESEGIEPSLYDGIPVYYYQCVYPEYFNSLSTDSDWWTGTKSDYSASINTDGAGYYEIINSSNEKKYVFWESISDLDENKNFQINAGIKIVSANNEDGGNGLVWGGHSNGELSYFRFFNNHDSYTILDDQGKDLEYWSDWTRSDSVNDIGTYNELTVRKYDGQYYFFINEDYIGSHPFKSFYGHYIGFRVDCETTIQVNYILVHHLESDS
ncbi:hypothetical protein JW835_06020 [bacterium]|nr:hypothetical protein [bacterium]